MNEPKWTDRFTEDELERVAAVLVYNPPVSSAVYRAAVEARDELDRRHTVLHEARERDEDAGKDARRPE